MKQYGYIAVVVGMTKQEWRVVLAIGVLLGIGAVTKWYRLAHVPTSRPNTSSPAAVIQPAKP